MVAFRHLTPDLIADDVSLTLNGHEAKIWQHATRLGIDPRSFKLDYVIPTPDSEDDEQLLENTLFEWQRKMLVAMEIAGESPSSFGSFTTGEEKMAALETALQQIEVTVASTCARQGIEPADIVEGWTATTDEEEDKKLEDLVAIMYKARSVIDALS